MKRFTTPLCFAVSLCFATGVMAKTETEIKTLLADELPTLKIDAVQKSPIAELWQVTAGPNILYVTQDGRYAIAGDIIDLQNKQTNLTEEVRKQARLKVVNTEANDFILFAPKKPKYTITVFTDVDCGYCRKLHAEVQKINELGIALRYAAFPRSGPESQTYEKMVKVWCAKDKKAAFNLAVEDKPIPGKVCDNNAVTNQLEEGLKLGVNGTPTLVFEDGTVIPGYLPPEKLLELAEQLKK